jgi:hypothetical protein
MRFGIVQLNCTSDYDDVAHRIDGMAHMRSTETSGETVILEFENQQTEKAT